MGIKMRKEGNRSCCLGTEKEDPLATLSLLYAVLACPCMPRKYCTTNHSNPKMPNPAVSRIDWELPANFSSEAEMEKMYDTTNNDFQNVVGMSVCVSAILGIVANIFVIVLSFGHVKGDFRHFVANLAIVDILCGFVFALMGYVNVFDDHNIPTQILYYMGLAFYGSFGIMIWALVPISVSRILALTKPVLYSYVFSGRRSVSFCLIADFLPVSVLYLICQVDHDTARWLFYGYAILTVIAYLLAFSTNYMVFQIVGMSFFLHFFSEINKKTPVLNR
ncbi:hypothetical protein WR25_20754 [Diploscapter pachys]|uniref:G-protein coupled receptors family 1 profile domain-containing protein n=1 Tax=Diploscapter pachys TaxID=2018661 RepID=A0A2A2LZA7_9BILA|nr:hypothetical protein WR25_20754 [Diploscapter pachys]